MRIEDDNKSQCSIEPEPGSGATNELSSLYDGDNSLKPSKCVVYSYIVKLYYFLFYELVLILLNQYFGKLFF